MSALRSLARDNKDYSDEEKIRIMKEYLDREDPTLSSYSSGRRSKSRSRSYSVWSVTSKDGG